MKRVHFRRVVLASVSALVLAACEGDPAHEIGAAGAALNTAPHQKFDNLTTIFYESFGFQRMWTSSGHARYFGNPPPAAEIPLLVLYADHACDKPWAFPRTTTAYDSVFFGSPDQPRSARAAFLEGSNGRFTYYQAAPSQHVCISATLPKADAFGWRANYALSDVPYDMRGYDTNMDGSITADELTIAVVHHAGSGGGANVAAGGPDTAACTDLALGKEYCGSVVLLDSRFDLATAVHELGHTLGAIDMYGSTGKTNPVGSVMSGTISGTMSLLSKHFDAVHKFQLGWIRPDVVDMANMPAGSRTIYCPEDPRAELDGSVLFWNSGRGKHDYFLLEGRCAGGFDDLGGSRGVALWSVMQDADQALYHDGYTVVGFQPGCVAEAQGVFTCHVSSVCLADTNPANAGAKRCFGNSLLKQRANGGNGWAPMIHDDLSAEPTRVRVFDRIFENGVLVGYTVQWTSASGTLPGYPIMGTPSVVSAGPGSTTGSLAVAWQMPAGLPAHTFSIEKANSDGSWSTIAGPLGRTLTSAQVSGLKASTSYAVRVCASRSEPSPMFPYMETDETLCSAPVTATSKYAPAPQGPTLPPSCPPGKQLCLNGCQPINKCQLPQ